MNTRHWLLTLCVAAILSGPWIALPKFQPQGWANDTASDADDTDDALFPDAKKGAPKKEAPTTNPAPADKTDDKTDDDAAEEKKPPSTEKSPTESSSTDAASIQTTPADTAAIDSGKDALNRAGDFNWYDKPKDAARRLEVDTSQPAPNSPSSAPNLHMSFSWFSFFGWLGIAVMLGILAWLLIRVFLMREQRLASHSSTELETTGTDADRVENLPVPVRRPTGDLLSEARMHYENGNYRDAIIYLYSHKLVSLDKHQMIRLVRGKTNRQYLRELTSRQPLYGLLEHTMLAFEEVFFGDLAITRERFESCWKRLPDFDALVQGARA